MRIIMENGELCALWRMENGDLKTNCRFGQDLTKNQRQVGEKKGNIFTSETFKYSQLRKFLKAGRTGENNPVTLKK